MAEITGDDKRENSGKTDGSSDQKVAFNPSNLPEYLRAYYQFLFPHSMFHQWLSYSNVDPEYFSRREFSFTLPGDIYLRFNSFDTMAEMRKSIMERLPMKIDIGAVYNSKPKDFRQQRSVQFHPMERELVFDIDMTDYDDVRTCCQGAQICPKCWPFMVVAAKILGAFLEQDFGFKNLLWVYSGRRGIHCWVADQRARQLKTDARDAVVNFIKIFDGGQFKAKKVEIDGLRGIHPSLARSIWIIDEHFEDLMVKQQDFLSTKTQVETIANLCLDPELTYEIKDVLLNDPKLKTSMDRWQMLLRLSQQFYKNQENRRNVHRHRYFIEEIKLQLCYPRLDVNVSKGLNHLLKVPFSVHPKTGRVCVPIDFSKIDEFDPFSVPTVHGLCSELDRVTVSKQSEESENHNSLQIAHQTSLAPSLNIFRLFIQNIEKCLRNIKLESIDNRMDF